MDFISKGARERLDETLLYIGNRNFGANMGAARVAEAHAFATAFVTRRFPVTAWYSWNSTMRAFSDHLSLGFSYQGGELIDDRKKRRAIYLLRAALRDAGAQAFDGGALPRTYTDNLDTMLLDDMWRAAVVHGQQTANTAAAVDMLRYIRLHPTTFLQTNRIYVRASNAQAGVPPGPAADLNVQGYCFQYNPATAHESYEFVSQAALANVLPGAYNFNAASVKGVLWSDVPNRGALPMPAVGVGFADIHGTELGGAAGHFMLTAQFSGCSFCIKQVGANIYAAHIMPSGAVAGMPNPMDGQRLARQLDGLEPPVVLGDFLNAPGATPFRVYGRGHSNHPHHAGGYPLQMVLLGFNAGGGVWRIYSQHRNGAGITGVVQIYP